MQDDVDELHFNPFATSVDFRRRPTSSSSPQNNSSYSPSSSPPSSSPNIWKSTGQLNQQRERTELQPVDTNSQDHHPLRSPGLSNGFEDAGITRPHLTRVLDSDRLVDAPSILDGDEGNDQGKSTEDEKMVIVHEVSPKDSLAGVALRYRINIAELRRANHLWASDPIHLRKYLYIPLEKTSLPTPPAGPSFSSSLAETASSCSPRSLILKDNTPSSTVRRVPASELSFFPPPSKPSALPSSFPPSPPLQLQTSNNINKILHTRHATSPAPSLNTILTALPIAASTRDTIIARLSLDSPSSSYSDREREPYFNGYEGHELSDVQARHESARGPKVDRPRFLNGVSMQPSKNSHYLPIDPPSERPGLSAIRSNGKAGSERLGLRHGRSFSEEYTGPPSLPNISSTRKVRNVQLEPSPVMQIPIRNNEILRQKEPDPPTNLGPKLSKRRV